MNLIYFLTPWEFSPLVAALCLSLSICYARGAHKTPVSSLRNLSFWSGLLMIYIVLQTYFDYYAQHMFWIHRVQHFILHYLGPFLLVLAHPGKTLALGLPNFLKKMLAIIEQNLLLRQTYSLVQMPLLATILFVGVIFFWLEPQIHLIAMLSYRVYNWMNWSMVIDGLLFWRLILDERPPSGGLSISYKKRLFLLWFIMPPQIILGAYIALSKVEIYSVYEICGRAWSISPLVDQYYAGLITWIPACMMSLIAAFVVVRMSKSKR